MTDKIRSIVDVTNHPKERGVYMKHFFSSADNVRLNNLEVIIDPECQISGHIHENASEYYYVVDGCGEFLIDGQWTPVKKGDAMMAPLGEEHGLKNTGAERFVLLSTFSPPIR